GDFWHGWRFPQWRDKLSEKWESKIAQNRMRDRRNHARLRRQGWTIVRVWEHQIERDLAGCLSRIKHILGRPKRVPALQVLNAEPGRVTASDDWGLPGLLAENFGGGTCPKGSPGESEDAPRTRQEQRQRPIRSTY